MLKSLRNLFRLANDKSINDKALKDIRSPFRLKNKGINDEALRDIKTLYEWDKEHYYKLVRISDACSSNYIECESDGFKEKTVFVDEYLDMIRQYLRDIINDHKTQVEWTTRLTMAIYFFSRF